MGTVGAPGDTRGHGSVRRGFATLVCIVAVAGFALAFVHACGQGGGSGDGTTSGAGPTDVTTDCRNYCEAQDRAGCFVMIPIDQCIIGCARVVEAYGECGEAWRAAMRCLSVRGFTCAEAGPRANDCTSEYAGLFSCLQARMDGGRD
jgi:hypothetical protein